MNKQIILGIIICLILAGGIAGYFIWQNETKQASFIQEVDRNLSQEDRQIYFDRLADADQKLAEAGNNQDRSDLLVYKGFQYQGLGQLALARDMFLQAAELTPDNYNIYTNLHLVYLEMGDYKKSEDTIKKSLLGEPNNPDAWKKYILLAVERLNRPETEIRDLYAQAEAAVKDKTDIYTSFAQYLEKIGDIEGAKKQWQKAIGTFPDNKEAYEAEIRRLSS